MKLEKKYSLNTSKNKLKKFGQYFTPEIIADIMSRWVTKKAKNILDPAVGNAIFYRHSKKYNQDIKFFGYEIDSEILDYFIKYIEFPVMEKDFLLSGWEQRYEGILCNPPYNKFQSIDNRKHILNKFYDNTGYQFSGYTNQYILFLIKSLYQLKENGRLCFIVPNEFLNSKYGEEIKENLVNNKWLKGIVNLDYNVFPNAITTSCILFIEKTENEYVEFINVKNEEELINLSFENELFSDNSIRVPMNELDPNERWMRYFSTSSFNVLNTKNNYVQLSKFVDVKRGIATGANKFFLFNKEKKEKYQIEDKFFSLTISRSADITEPVCKAETINTLINKNKNVFLLDVHGKPSSNLLNYIKEGEIDGYNEKYIPKHRTPWYSVENKKAAPILISSSFRDKIKVIRNLCEVKSLTTFHSVYIKDGLERYTNILFCYLLTTKGQTLLLNNRKEMGNGLIKFQPNDYNEALMLDITKISENDLEKIKQIYLQIINNNNDDIYINQLEKIFDKYF